MSFSDYKYEIQKTAEKIALQKYGKDFFDLTPDQKEDAYCHAGMEWAQQRQAQAEERGERL